ncbi:piwi domain-containing protein [Ditylenchus destructor]|uniref:Piwi domain-containing protein n=1 Tax=Ditylenchus destructor TaxID=166010 RepID=A0AAD4R027_9BILA|nr:piwi domain-containing protein [Ditylenchus destructor]
MAEQPAEQQEQLPEVDLPEKVRNEHRIRNVEEAKIVLNAYRLDVSHAVEKVHKFELKFMGRIPPETEKDISRGARNDVANQARRRLLWEMCTQMITMNPNVFGEQSHHRNYVYDCGINFYSITNLGMNMAEARTFVIDRNLLPPEQNGYLGRRVESIEANLLYCEVIDLRALGQSGELRSRSAVQFLDILSNQEVIRRNGYYIFQSKMFEKASEIRLPNDPRIMKEGMQKNVRIVGNSLESATPVIQIDPKKSAFFPEMTVHEFLDKFLSGRDPDLGRRIFSQIRIATKQIKGLSVVTTHLEIPRTFTVHGLTTSLNAMVGDASQWSTTLRTVIIEPSATQTWFPCVVEKMSRGGGITDSFYPIELVKIVAGQRVSFDQQTTVLVDQMIRNCQTLPSQFKPLNEKQKNNAFISSGNPFFRTHNVRVDSDIIEASGQDEEYIQSKFEFYKQHNAEFVMFFTKEKLDTVHHTMKLMEVKFGIITQHISKPTMEKALGTRGAYLVIDNLLMKFNLKLGGVNHGLSTSNVMVSANRFTHDVVKEDWLRDSRMFIGLDMSHAAPQSLFERQKGEKPTEPTIVSMAYTVGHPLKPRQFVTNLVTALQTYNKEVRRFPEHIMVFRGGVSEGEYQKVATVEFGAFEAAFEHMEQKQREFQRPQVTIIVVQQQSNYRIVPVRVDSRDKAKEQNVRAGTVVDEQVMHPVYTEFLLVGHHTIQGTARPSRCTVVVDTCNPRISLEELEYVTYHLCYAHGIVCSPVSVPAPLKAAADLKKRGRNNWKVVKDDRSTERGSETERGPETSRRSETGRGPETSHGSETERESEIERGSEHFFIDLTNELRPIIPTKFWA